MNRSDFCVKAAMAALPAVLAAGFGERIFATWHDPDANGTRMTNLQRSVAVLCASLADELCTELDGEGRFDDEREVPL